MTKRDNILLQIDTVLNEFAARTAEARGIEIWDWETARVVELSGRLGSAVGRLAPHGSHHRRTYEQIMNIDGYGWQSLRPLVGVLTALRLDYASGFLGSVEELIHGETFSGFLDMADHLQSSGYKDAAAVVAGSVLEQHLRGLCQKHGIEVMVDDKFKKAEALNVALAGASVYSKLDQKNVTSWLGLRNDAAHGNYDVYGQQQVRLLIDSISDFLTRNPA